MQKDTFDSFFESYAKNVDKAERVSAFWRLSDELITRIIKNEIAPRCHDQSVVMDAGGGTGRWAVKLADVMAGQFVIFDRSADMLQQAQVNISASAHANRIKTIEGDLTHMKEMLDESVDHIVSIYSPLSFIYEQDSAAKELYRVLKPGGKMLIMSHGFHNAVASKINNYNAASVELKQLNDSKIVKWAPYVPDLVTQSKETIESLFSNAGFAISKTYGVPVFVQPGPEDFDPENEQRSPISTYLEDGEVFEAIAEIEMEHNAKETVCNRGMNMFVLVEKK